MDATHMDAIVAAMSAGEIEDALRFVQVCERSGMMDKAEAEEWRRRIRDRAACLGAGSEERN